MIKKLLKKLFQFSNKRNVTLNEYDFNNICNEQTELHRQNAELRKALEEQRKFSRDISNQRRYIFNMLQNMVKNILTTEIKNVIIDLIENKVLKND